MSLSWRRAKSNKGDSQQLLNKGIQLYPRASNNFCLKLVSVSTPTPGNPPYCNSLDRLGARDPLLRKTQP